MALWKNEFAWNCDGDSMNFSRVPWRALVFAEWNRWINLFSIKRIRMLCNVLCSASMCSAWVGVEVKAPNAIRKLVFCMTFSGFRFESAAALYNAAP